MYQESWGKGVPGPKHLGIKNKIKLNRIITELFIFLTCIVNILEPTTISRLLKLSSTHRNYSFSPAKHPVRLAFLQYWSSKIQGD